VAEQDVPDGRFPTVESPNPENADALTMAMKLADKTGADLVVATDRIAIAWASRLEIPQAR
jgi:phosphoglucomutase